MICMYTAFYLIHFSTCGFYFRIAGNPEIWYFSLSFFKTAKLHNIPEQYWSWELLFINVLRITSNSLTSCHSIHVTYICISVKRNSSGELCSRVSSKEKSSSIKCFSLQLFNSRRNRATFKSWLRDVPLLSEVFKLFSTVSAGYEPPTTRIWVLSTKPPDHIKYTNMRTH